MTQTIKPPRYVHDTCIHTPWGGYFYVHYKPETIETRYASNVSTNWHLPAAPMRTPVDYNFPCAFKFFVSEDPEAVRASLEAGYYIAAQHLVGRILSGHDARISLLDELFTEEEK